MKKILIISFSPLHSDPRVNRQIRFLANQHHVIAAGLTDPKIPNVDFLPLTLIPSIPMKRFGAMLKLVFKQYNNYYFSKQDIRQSIDLLNNIECDLIIANDIDSLPLALEIKKDAKIIFDAHEYAPREFEDRLLFRLLLQNYKTYLCQTYIPQVDRMITVCQTIANTYQQDTGIKPTVITNAPDYEDIQPQLLTAETPKIRLVHHGGAMKSRRLDKLISLMNFLDERFELNLILTGPFPDYIDHLKKLAKHNPNIHFLMPVPMREIPQYLNSFDIGIYILEPSNFNNLNALPNKLFEFIQARLAIAIGPSPEMARIVKYNDLGVIAEDFDPQSLAKKIIGLDYQKINYYKQQSHKVAYELSAEHNKQILLNLVQETLHSS